MASGKATEIPTPRNTVLLEKLTGHKPVKKFPRILKEPESSLQHSQASTTYPCPEPDQYNPFLLIAFLENPF
jgi:hypothetical protein